MKKFFGMLMLVAATAMLWSAFIAPKQDEAKNVAEMKSQMATPVAYTSEASEEPEIEESDPFYTNLLSHEHGKDVGVLSINDNNIEVVVRMGADDNADIKGCAGLHETLSSDEHLVIFAHHTENGTLFGNLKNVSVGTVVSMETIEGVKNFKVIDSQYYTVEQMSENDFELLRNEGNLILVTCDWNDNVKGRRIVVCEQI